MNVPDKLKEIEKYRIDIIKHISTYEEAPEAMVLITALLNIIDTICEQCNLNLKDILTVYTQISDNYMSITDIESQYLQ